MGRTAGLCNSTSSSTFPVCNFRLDKHSQRKHTLFRECELVDPTPTACVTHSPKRCVADAEFRFVSNNRKLISIGGRCPGDPSCGFSS